MEITIKNKTYPLKASFAFLKKIESMDRRTADGTEMDMGLVNAIVMARDTGDMRYLVDLIWALNAGQKPVLERSAVESYLEDECEDPEALLNEVIDFLSRANVCKLRLKKMGIIKEQATENPSLSA
ncbi:tail assembly chaperone [Faecalibaculum rodentium]|uniref:tail assembly chaperone n=1 Tax=Faecalibaculum rodentium TaxID=1702221 RepID=UPI001F57527E|nr:tail assembly chaperone [Faecalibaculum rodentium]